MAAFHLLWQDVKAIRRCEEAPEVRLRKELFFRHLSSLGSDSNHFPHGTQYTTSGSFQRTSAHVHNNDHSLISSFDSTSSHHRQPTRVHRHVVACCGSDQQSLCLPSWAKEEPRQNQNVASPHLDTTLSPLPQITGIDRYKSTCLHPDQMGQERRNSATTRMLRRHTDQNITV